MKKSCALILIILCMLFLFSSCSGVGKNREKLIGNWKRAEYYSIPTIIPGVMNSGWFVTWLYFHNNGKVYMEQEDESNYTGTSTDYQQGTFTMDKEKVVITFENGEVWNYAYYINEYNKELVLDPDKTGDSEWHKYDDKPPKTPDWVNTK